ncbi:hypothetical protein F2Q69_00046085 [Brassica cretica]|uniref:Uncharacterized protein n=1 Tax=Brassica cretica TaxID=69181 RepID=A0A8S9PP25_BRACR|nr:hypothetical protein F2Q69_00046085 [Brassica cretica]
MGYSRQKGPRIRPKSEMNRICIGSKKCKVREHTLVAVLYCTVFWKSTVNKPQGCFFLFALEQHSLCAWVLSGGITLVLCPWAWIASVDLLWPLVAGVYMDKMILLLLHMRGRLSMTRSSCSLPPLGSISGSIARTSGSKVVGTCFFCGVIGLHLIIRWAALDPEPGTQNLGPGTSEPEPGSWNSEPRTLLYVEVASSSVHMLGKHAYGMRRSNSCVSPGDWASFFLLLPPGRTQTPGSPIKDRSRSPLNGTLGPVPGTDVPSKKWKISDKENLPYFRIWKSST